MSDEKLCKDFQQVKPISDFYTCMRGKYIRTYCKPCFCQRVVESLRKNPERNKKRREYAKKARKRESVSRAYCEYQAKYIAKNPEKRSAHKAVERALEKESLIRLPCERCGSDRSQAHHEDYSKPLEVVWLCPLHHMARHREIEKEKRSP